MPNKDIFCNSPWYELQIYWDGSLGFCCQEAHKPYADHFSQEYNVQNMSIREWYNSEPMKQARLLMFENQKNTICSRCYNEEEFSPTSKRHRNNQKSVIFTKTAFNESYLQSPGYKKFEHSQNLSGEYNELPIDLHIDLGNYCNLTCKMCRPVASSSIAHQHVKWGITDAAQYIGTDWTKDQTTWGRVVNEIASIPKLQNIHFMGGETLITKRFEDFVDAMLSRDRTDLHFSFVTNGTVFNESLLNKLKKFKRVGIEVSIECLTDHNTYQRQGTDTKLVLANIEKYLEQCNGTSITLTVRPAISLLTIGYYPTLIEYCLNKQLVIKGLIVTRPDYFDCRILPDPVKKLYVDRYHQLIQKYNLDTVDCESDYNESDPNQISKVIKNQIIQCINLLNAPSPPNSDNLITEMVRYCRKWDDVHGYNALKLYPELATEFEKNGY